MTSLLERFGTPHGPGALLQALNPRWASRLPGAHLQGVVTAVEPTGIDAAAIRIRPGRGWKGHRPGQFVTLGVEVDGVLHHRCFSITSLPDAPDGLIEITVQAHAAGPGEPHVVSPHLVHHIAAGAVVRLSQAEGDFVLPDLLDQRTPGGVERSGSTAAAPPLLFITGGSGITPVLAMLRHLAASTMGGAATHLDVVLIHHATSDEAVLHGAELRALAAAMPWLTVQVHLTRDSAGRRRRNAHFGHTRLEADCPDWADRLTWACGPVGLLESVQAEWQTHGVADRLMVESFQIAAPAAAAPADLPDTPVRATFANSGIEVDASATDSLLHVAEEAGLCPPSGCRMGICHTCSTPLAAGVARDLRDGRLTVAGEHVQLCVAAALTDITLEL